MNRRPAVLLGLFALVGGITSSPAQVHREAAASALQMRIERLGYSITFLGIPVARALIEEAVPLDGSGPVIVRSMARTTAFWETFFRLGNVYTTWMDAGTSTPRGYDRSIEERGVHHRRTEWYGEVGDAPSLEGLPAVPPRYLPEEEPRRVVVEQAASGHHNLFTALRMIRHHDWDRDPGLVLPMWVDGVPWRLEVTLDGIEERRVLGERVRVWRVRCRFQPEGESGRGASLSDYVTRELVREDSVVRFWVEHQAPNRPIAIEVHRPGITVKGQIRELYEDERIGG